MIRSRTARRALRALAVAAALGAGTLGARALGAQAVPRLAAEKYVLPNGLEVILHEDHSTPVVAVDTWYHVGSAEELRGRTGFAHLFEHIMFMGSEHVPVGAFDQWLEAAGGNNNGSTTEDRTNYYEWMPSNALPLALWLDADRMGHLLPTMDLPKVDLQRDVVKNERRQRVDNEPYGRANEIIGAALYPANHPYSWPVIGSMTDLSAASIDDVRNFFRKFYAPNNATLTIAGDFNPDSVKAWVNQYFGGIPRGPETVVHATAPQFTVARDTFLVLEDKVQLPRIYYTWHSVKAFAPDDAALDALAYVLAGDKNARLYKSMVYEKQVAQNVFAYQNSGRIDGSFGVVISPKPQQAPADLARMADAEIARVAREGITQRELDRAKNTLRTQMLDRIASVNGKADQLNFYNYYVGTPDYTREDAARYDRLTTADIQAAATRYLANAHKVVLTVVPEGKSDMMVKGVMQ